MSRSTDRTNRAVEARWNPKEYREDEGDGEKRRKKNRSVGNGGAESEGIRDTVMLHRRQTGQLETLLARFLSRYPIVIWRLGVILIAGRDTVEYCSRNASDM